MHHNVSSPNFRARPPTSSGTSAVAGVWSPHRFAAVGTDSDLKLRLAYAIKYAREQRGLTPPQLAERLGRSRGTVNDWENGKSVPSLLDLGPICRELGVDPRLFADLPPIPASPVDEYLVDLGRGAARLALEDLEREEGEAPDA